MIEYGHKRALEVAQAQLRQGALTNNPEVTLIAARQAEAVSRSLIASKTIFQELNVSDIPFSTQDPDLHTELIERNFGETLSYFLNNRGYTQTRFAQTSGISGSIVSKLISGSRKPGLKTFTKIIGGFGWTIDNWEARILLEKAAENAEE